MSTSESIPPEVPDNVPRFYFSCLYAEPDEINVRCQWLVEQAGLDRIERAVLGTPSLMDRVRSFGSKLMSAAEDIPQI